MILSPKGTRDFNADEIYNRQYIVKVITDVFERYGFEPIETPSFEYTNLLTNKYGEESEKLIFRIVDSGDVYQKSQQAKSNKEILQAIAEKSLRYDQTIPMSRYVQNHFHRLCFPFRRYQNQLVWRADRPQKGRFREFLQCDADVIGSASLLCELDILHIYHHVFQKLGIKNYQIHINHRLFFKALANKLEDKSLLSKILISVDKLSKVGKEKVMEEISKLQLSNEFLNTLELFLVDSDASSNINQTAFMKLKEIFSDDTFFCKGMEDILHIINHSSIKKENIQLIFNPSLARGLDYYTGLIFEAIINDVEIGSVGGGGRYDNIVKDPHNKSLACVGLSFGVDRIYEVLKTKSLFPNQEYNVADILFFNLGKEEVYQCYLLAEECRKKNIGVLIFDKLSKMDKQFKFALNKKIPYVAILGSQELESKEIKIKHLATKVQTTISFEECAECVKQLLSAKSE